MNRLLVRARVNDLQKVPQFIVYSDPDTLNGDSWTIQCELLLHHPNEAPPQEDQVPQEGNFENGMPFDFFGLGQQVNGNGNQEDDDQNQVAGLFGQDGQNQQQEQHHERDQNVWDPWPAEFLPQQPMQIDVAPALGQNLNELPAAENPAIDLNQPALDLDLHPVIANPEVPLNQDLIDINDIHVNMFEQHLLHLENEVYLADPMEEELMDLADGMHQEQL